MAGIFFCTNLNPNTFWRPRANKALGAGEIVQLCKQLEKTRPVYLKHNFRFVVYQQFHFHFLPLIAE
jgi:hypothetical protein